MTVVAFNEGCSTNAAIIMCFPGPFGFQLCSTLFNSPIFARGSKYYCKQCFEIIISWIPWHINAIYWIFAAQLHMSCRSLLSLLDRFPLLEVIVLGPRYPLLGTRYYYQQSEVLRSRSNSLAASSSKTFWRSHLHFCTHVYLASPIVTGNIVGNITFLSRRLCFHVKQYLNIVRLVHLEAGLHDH